MGKRREFKEGFWTCGLIGVFRCISSVLLGCASTAVGCWVRFGLVR